MNNFKLNLLAASVFGILASGTAQAIVIDDFSHAQSSSVTSSTANAVSTATESSIDLFLGTTRTLTISDFVGNGAGANGIYADIGPDPTNPLNTVLSMANGPVATSTITIEWSGIDHVDLTMPTATGLYLALPNAIDNDLTVLFSINGGASTYSKTFLDGSSGADFFINFSLFNVPTAANDVTSFSMAFSGPTAWDAQIDLVETREGVPEPATLGLFGIGLLGFAASRRRKAA